MKILALAALLLTDVDSLTTLERLTGGKHASIELLRETGKEGVYSSSCSIQVRDGNGRAIPGTGEFAVRSIDRAGTEVRLRAEDRKSGHELALVCSAPEIPSVDQVTREFNANPEDPILRFVERESPGTLLGLLKGSPRG